MTQVLEAKQVRRVDLILRQIDTLPTLASVATRLLSLTADDEAQTSEVIELISSDPALTAKVLSLCKQSDRNIRDEVLTIDRAVILLGFTAVRNAVLSVKVVETFDRLEKKPQCAVNGDPLPEGTESARFDRAAFWRHSLAVAILAELIAKGHPSHRDLPAGEAFVCGLLHDVGKVALDHLLPRAFEKVIELTELNQGNIAEFERRVIGLDHHVAGKRLAEQWGMPHRLQDCIWLHGSGYDTLPKLDHRRLMGLVTLADLLARRTHVGYSGNHLFTQEPEELAERLDLDAGVIDQAVAQLHEELERRATLMNLDVEPSRELFLDSIRRANTALGRVNAALDRRSRQAARQQQALGAIEKFHDAAEPGRGVTDVIDQAVRSACDVFGEGFYAVLYALDGESGGGQWQLHQYTHLGEPLQNELIAPPPYAPDLTQMDSDQSVSMSLMGLLPWMADYVVASRDLRDVRLMPLPSGWGTAGVLLHNRDTLPPREQLRPLLCTWGSAIAAAAQHDGARRLGEELADTNRSLSELQQELLAAQSMARLGEMAAGAAHEMNNPLSVISGRSQLLAMSLQPGSDTQRTAATIYEQAHRLSDLITSLRMFADPPKPQARKTDVGVMLDEAIKKSRERLGKASDDVSIYLRLKADPPAIVVDADQISQVIQELIINAVQAHPKSSVEVICQMAGSGGGVQVLVADDGEGMEPRVLQHATDPFFSAKPAGRRMGMGLAKAMQWAVSNNAKLDIRSTHGRGTLVTLSLPLDCTQAKTD